MPAQPGNKQQQRTIQQSELVETYCRQPMKTKGVRSACHCLSSLHCVRPTPGVHESAALCLLALSPAGRHRRCIPQWALLNWHVAAFWGPSSPVPAPSNRCRRGMAVNCLLGFRLGHHPRSAYHNRVKICSYYVQSVRSVAEPDGLDSYLIPPSWEYCRVALLHPAPWLCSCCCCWRL
jgi:hypothetical protein